MDSGKHLPAVASPKQSKASHLPVSLNTSKKISQGIEELNSFGFKTSVTHADPSLLLLFRSHFPFSLGFHVSDLWSQRQQQEFLKAMKLERAQMARERQAHFVNFLAESKKKLGKAVSLQDLQSEIEKALHREAMEKYRGKEGAATARQAASLSPKALTAVMGENRRGASFCKHTPKAVKPRRLVCLEDFIGHCKSTLKTFKKHQEMLPDNNRKEFEPIPDDFVADSNLSLKILGKKKFAASSRR